MGTTPSKKRRSFEEDINGDSHNSVSNRNRSHSNESYSETRCNQLFDKYSNQESNMMEPDGIEKFCDDLGVAPDNVVMLLISWKFEAETMGYFSREEWLRGMKKMNCDTIEKLKANIPKLLQELKDNNSFKEIYRYSFDFSKDKGQKSLDVNTAQGMWMLLMKDKFEHTELFLNFLMEKNPVKVINRDQWTNFLEFCEAIQPDLSNYDEMSAWPVILDEYVEWRKSK